MKVHSTNTATAFRRALEDRLATTARDEHVDLQRIRRQVAFDRLLTRLLGEGNPPWILKGAYSLELKLHTARTTKDIDLGLAQVPASGDASQLANTLLGNLADGGSVDAHRLRNGHTRNKSFALELSRVVPLPHQRIAVYEHMLAQSQLRFLLADDAGAGKTIMTGLYIREMLNRGRIQRVLIVAPAGLLTNWHRELAQLFDLPTEILNRTRIEQGALDSARKGLFILSVDTGAMPAIRERLKSDTTGRLDLVVFDECHKLSWPDPKRPRTRRYMLAEALATRCTHLLLLTATPHMGKPHPYHALWRLLDPNLFPTGAAVSALPAGKRRLYFIRRLKE